MTANRVFQAALIISLAVHGAIFVQNAHFNLWQRPKDNEKMEVRYVKKEERRLPRRTFSIPKNDPLLKISSDIAIKAQTLNKIIGHNPLGHENNISVREHFIKKPDLIKPDVISVRKKITLIPPPAEPKKPQGTTYISYSDVLYEKIKRALHDNYKGSQTGEEYLDFVIDKEGNLKEMRIRDERSAPSQFLKEIVFKSVKDSLPFPPFPKELDYRELPFSVVISFQSE